MAAYSTQQKVVGEVEGSSPRVDESWTVLWWWQLPGHLRYHPPLNHLTYLAEPSGFLAWPRLGVLDEVDLNRSQLIQQLRAHVSVSSPAVLFNADVPPSSLHTGPR